MFDIPGPDDMFDAPLGQDEDEEEDDELSDSPDEDGSEMKHMQNVRIDNLSKRI